MPKADLGPLTPQSSTVVAHHERESWNSALGIANADASANSPTPYQAFIVAMRGIPIASDEDVFVDYGAGKGRIVIIAATFRLRRVLGIELSLQLAAKAQNI
jgi:hypothetical protein